MKYKLFVMSTLVMMILTGCSNKNDLYKNGTEELANGNYEKAIELFIEYKNTYSDSKPLKESYCQYADFLYNNNKYIDSLCYYKLASKLGTTDNTISENIENVSNVIYNKGIEFLDNGEELLAFQYLSYVKNYVDFDNEQIPEAPLLGIWHFEQNYIYLTKSSMSYLYSVNINHIPTSQDFTQESILILGEWYINDEGNIEIDDNLITHHNENYIYYIEIIDNDTIYIDGDNTLTGEYKRIQK